MPQLILHLVGDYLLQSDWMAIRKHFSSWAAFLHALTYSLPFLLIGSPEAVGAILVSHFFIDRFNLARYLIWAKNYAFAPVDERWQKPWKECKATGYHKDKPAWLAVWLMILADNTLHLACNYLALKHL